MKNDSTPSTDEVNDDQLEQAAGGCFAEPIVIGPGIDPVYDPKPTLPLTPPDISIIQPVAPVLKLEK